MMLGCELTPWQTPFWALTEMQREMNQLFSCFFGEGEQVGNRWQSLRSVVVIVYLLLPPASISATGPVSFSSRACNSAIASKNCLSS
jgi:hypothetical protein